MFFSFWFPFVAGGFFVLFSSFLWLLEVFSCLRGEGCNNVNINGYPVIPIEGSAASLAVIYLSQSKRQEVSEC